MIPEKYLLCFISCLKLNQDHFNTTTTNFTPRSLEMLFTSWMSSFLIFTGIVERVQGGTKRGNPSMATSTITARSKGDPQHMLREKG